MDPVLNSVKVLLLPCYILLKEDVTPVLIIILFFPLFIIYTHFSSSSFLNLSSSISLYRLFLKVRPGLAFTGT